MTTPGDPEGGPPRNLPARVAGLQRELDMKLVAALGLALIASPAFADQIVAPEIDALSGLAAMGALAGVVTLAWERRRRK